MIKVFYLIRNLPGCQGLLYQQCGIYVRNRQCDDNALKLLTSFGEISNGSSTGDFNNGAIWCIKNPCSSNSVSAKNKRPSIAMVNTFAPTPGYLKSNVSSAYTMSRSAHTLFLT